ncbi:hypothetical protein JCM33374_g560 [Metschnikowia sp. JCM 33374]|nr:hypothetical protein JCM33374_g560 [Metschnikowia sp. JCM 33374]
MILQASRSSTGTSRGETPDSLKSFHGDSQNGRLGMYVSDGINNKNDSNPDMTQKTLISEMAKNDSYSRDGSNGSTSRDGLNGSTSRDELNGYPEMEQISHSRDDQNAST